MNNTLFSIAPWVVVLTLQLSVPNKSIVDVHEDTSTISIGDLKAVQIDTVYGDRSVFTGEEHNYRVRVKEGATWPIKYEWTIDETYRTIGNNIVHRFDKPGKVAIDVVVSNPYGSDTKRIWVWVVDNRNLNIAERKASSQTRESEGGGQRSRNTDTNVLPIDVVTAGTYYSWIVETHLSRLRAESAAIKIAEMGFPHVRVYEDAMGNGSPAYRVLVGKYKSQRSAINHKPVLEKELDRHVSLITLRSAATTD